jgi:pyridoxal 5'-phosphate synthase pdxS subunit
MSEIRRLTSMDEDELFAYAKNIQAPYELVKETAELGRLPVVNFAAGGVATPADAALMMQLGVDGAACLSAQASSRAVIRPNAQKRLSKP